MIASQVFSSVGIGLLIGILLGLSTSPVVGLAVGSITALLASLLGLKIPKKNGEQATDDTTNREQQKLIGIRAGFFGLTCVVGIFIGIYMRTHNVLSPPELTLKQQIAELTAIGFSAQEARELVVPHATGTNPFGKKISEERPIYKTNLFATDLEIRDQIVANTRRFADISTAIKYYRDIEQPRFLKIARIVNDLAVDEKTKIEIMRSVVDALCIEE